MRTVKALLLLLLGIFLVSATVGVTCVAFYEAITKRSQWFTAQGSIISSKAQHDTSNDVPISAMFTSRDWLVIVSFEYEVQDKRYSCYQQWYTSKAETQKELVKYSPGAIVPVYYDSNLPTFGVVEPEKRLFSIADLIFPILIIIPLLGGGIILIALASRDLLKGISAVLMRR